MIANVAFLAGVTVFLTIAWLAGELSFLAPYRTVIFHRHANLLGAAALLMFLNLCAVYYSVARWLFLRDAGRKLQHLDRQLTTPDAALEELRLHLKS
jgi:Na+/phosphate symporter